jgi:putative hemolysin
MFRWAMLAALLAGVVGCADSNKIQGNETGGIVPAIVKNNADAAAAAADFCKQYGRSVKITAQGSEAGGTTVFVCLAPGKQSPFER